MKNLLLILFLLLLLPEKINAQPFGSAMSNYLDEAAWLNKNIVPLEFDSTIDIPNEKAFSGLHYTFGDKNIIALGEVSHGSREIYLLKVNLIKYLIVHEGFTVFAIEAQMPEAYQLNEYILTGKGDARELIKGMYFWMWDTEAMLDLVEWMRLYNLQTTHKVTFWGCDMQYTSGALSEIQRVFKNIEDTIVKNNLDILQSKITELDLLRKKEKDSISKIIDIKGHYVPYVRREGGSYFDKEKIIFKSMCEQYLKDPDKRKWAIQCYQIIYQYCSSYGPDTRDRYMAQNFDWIKSRFAGAKTIIWAHNGHVQKSLFSMGSYLHKKYASEYYSIGFTFNDGSYTAEGPDGITSYVAQPSFNGTYEHILKEANSDVFFLDLKSCEGYDLGCKWIGSNLLLRCTGNGKMRYEFRQWDIAAAFDAMIFIRHSTPSRLLHKWP